jgi:hypothetical protein
MNRYSFAVCVLVFVCLGALGDAAATPSSTSPSPSSAGALAVPALLVATMAAISCVSSVWG